MEINYPQWIAFALYSFKQARWVLVSKPEKRHSFVMDSLESDIARIGTLDGSGVLLLGS